MYEYGWASDLSPGPGVSSGYYVGILQHNNTIGLGYFLTTQANPQVECQTYDNSLCVLMDIMIIIIQDQQIMVQIIIS
jgi:hypothetical protein